MARRKYEDTLFGDNSFEISKGFFSDIYDIISVGVLVAGTYYLFTKTDLADKLQGVFERLNLKLPKINVQDGKITVDSNTDSNNNQSTDTGSITPVKGVGFDKNGVTKIYATAGGKESYNATNSDNPGRKEWDIGSAGFLNMEMTGYFKTNIDEIAFKLRGGEHTDSCPDCGCCIQVRATPGSGNFALECPHPKYDFKNIGTKFRIRDFRNRWVGVKAIVFNSGSGVKVLAYIDEGGITAAGKPANQWRLWYEANVSGSKWRKNPVNGPKAKVSFRIDSKNTQGRFMSIREIGSSASLAKAFHTRIAY